MIALFSDSRLWPSQVTETTAPEPKPAPSPVFIGDILSARLDQPELLLRWRKDREAAKDQR